MHGARRSKPAADQPANVVRLTSWRVAAGWALGCVLAAGSVTGGIYEQHHRQEVARSGGGRGGRAAEAGGRAARRLKEDEDLLAKVDSDVSREVPSAMEPLAQLMAEDEAQ